MSVNGHSNITEEDKKDMYQQLVDRFDSLRQEYKKEHDELRERYSLEFKELLISMKKLNK